MNLEEIQELVDKDLKINDSELDLESIKTPQIHNKYMKLLTKFKLMLSRNESEFHIIKKQKWEYYTGKATPEVYQEHPFDLKVLKVDVGIYLDADKELQQLGQKEAYLETTVNYLEKVLREITNRNWTIRNAIEWKKFLHGD